MQENRVRIARVTRPSRQTRRRRFAGGQPRGVIGGLDARSFGKSGGADRVEDLVRAAGLFAGVTSAALAAPAGLTARPAR